MYISIEYKTATHLCACGCGNKVMTSITPTGWTLSYNGDNVSLNPSIGSWNLPCKSHYWIRSGQVVWAESWTEEQIVAVQKRDAVDRNRHYKNKKSEIESEQQSNTINQSFFSKFFHRFFI
ncbi:MAG: DUF6527 family protein [Sulfurimonas sp.]|uniref:DUF6527 family protein n=1 Tax=Sulfurimonas sp. TaxID=2022749 RepID=UPI00260546EA|nr:DUF6527 family protein [Sulfurimonas sp.]MDD5372925.1 DUF6527 family protein [Sulfurimonas sp.]